MRVALAPATMARSMNRLLSSVVLAALLSVYFFLRRRGLRPVTAGVLLLIVTGFAMAVAVPFGLGDAVFMSEFTSGAYKEGLKIAIENLLDVRVRHGRRGALVFTNLAGYLGRKRHPNIR